MKSPHRFASGFVLVFLTCLAASAQGPANYLHRPPEDDVLYFLLVDRFANGDHSNDNAGVSGGRLVSGFDPTDAEFYQGGDLKGVLDHLDYIQKLGATAIWISPIFRNQWVQSGPAGASAAYHGYWITDFTDVDPHFGTRADFKKLVDAAHARGLKIYLDIVINHTADIIRYRECPTVGVNCTYRSEADYPYTLRGGSAGEAINPGFLGTDPSYQTEKNFSKLIDPAYAYTPFVPKGLEHVKKPEWLNDPIYYHNRGDSTFQGESSLMGDFGGLDDVMTEHPRVLAGFIQIYKLWITDFHIDGYRVDTARHVNSSFWRVWVPAILAHAHAQGIPNFHIFGEVLDPDPAATAAHTRSGGLPYVLDFPFQHAAQEVIGGRQPPNAMRKLFAADADYQGGAQAAQRLPIFLGNHDIGRFAWLVKRESPAMSNEELLRRTELGYALTLFSRGIPTIYYGDEQGMAGTGDYAGARQTMFASQVASYKAEIDLGDTEARADHFQQDGPLFRAIEELTRLRATHPGLRHGEQEVRAAAMTPGLYIFTRTDPHDGQYLIALNTSTEAVTGNSTVGPEYREWISLHGACAPGSFATGAVHVEVPALGYIVCRSEARR